MHKRVVLVGSWFFCTVAVNAIAQQAIPAWYSGFETGFPGDPGEWLPYDPEAFNPEGQVNPGYNTAWTILKGGEVNYAGQGVYKGWPVAAQRESHRAYPVIHVDIPSPLVNSFMVYLDLDYDSMSPTEWVHLATWANNTTWKVHTLSVRDRKLEMAHLDWDRIGGGSVEDFPLRRWVRITAYIHYDGDQGTVRLWQDGKAVIEGTYRTVAGRNLMRAHWGWYSSGSVTHGAEFNDEIQIWKLSEPLKDLEHEPRSPYSQRVSNPGPSPDGASAGSRASGAGGLNPGVSRGGATQSAGTAGTPASRPPSMGGAGSIDPKDDAGCSLQSGSPPSGKAWVVLLGVLSAFGMRRRSRR